MFNLNVPTALTTTLPKELEEAWPVPSEESGVCPESYSNRASCPWARVVPLPLELHFH